MVRVEYPDGTMEDAMADYRKLTRQAYKLLKGTWGYSQLEYETWQTKKPDGPLVPASNPFAGMNQNQIIASLFDNDFVNILRGYICFKDEMDALQFRLSISAKAIQVRMWPKNREFTIHEVVETDGP
jgi:hypothetical protein